MTATQPPTQIGAAENETEIVAPVDYPEPLAWSETDDVQWPSRRRRKVWWLGLPALAVGGAVVAFVLVGGRPQTVVTQPVTVPPAAVSPPPTFKPLPHPPSKPLTADDRFVAALINHDAPITLSETAIHNAHAVCNDLGNGSPRSDIAESIREAIDGYNATRAAIFVSLSIDYYCPQYH